MAGEDKAVAPKPEPAAPKVKALAPAPGLLVMLANKERALMSSGRYVDGAAVHALANRLASTKAYLDDFDASLVPEIQTLKASL